jgi:uncharacterized protein (TIGR03435 family)
MTGRTVTLTELAVNLSNAVGRVVIDRTGLLGTFDLDLEFAPDQPPSAALAGVPPTPNDASGASIFTAVQEQLGLRLSSTTGPVDVLVIDHVERPTED